MSLINWEKFQKYLGDKVMDKMKIETNPMYSERFRKFARWWAYKLPPIMSGIASFIVMVWFFSRVEDKYGINKVFIIFGLIIIFTLRGMAKNLGKISGE